MIAGGEVALHRDKLYLPEQIGLKKARIVSVRNHFAFASLSDEEEDVYIDQTDLHGAFPDDVVYLKMHGNAGEVFRSSKRAGNGSSARSSSDGENAFSKRRTSPPKTRNSF